MKKLSYIVIAISFIVITHLSCDKEEKLKDIENKNYTGKVLGVSENVVVIDNDDTNVETENYDINTGNYTVAFQDSVPQLSINSVLVIDSDTAGYLRKITSVTQNGNELSVNTEQANLEDVFYDIDFKLSTKIFSPEQKSLKGLSPVEISETLTDTNGYIHPLEIYTHTADGLKLKINVFENNTKTNIGSGLYKYYDFSKMNIIDENSTKLYIDEGYFEFDPVINLEFEFDREVDNLWDIVRGKISKFGFYSDKSKIEFKSILKFDASGSYTKTTPITIKDNLIKTTLKFLVAGVPVWITIDCDLLAKNQFNINAKATATTGIKSTRTVTCGAIYENSDWNPIYNYTKTDIIYPLQVEGNVSLFDRFEVFPNTKILIFSAAGPNFDIVPYLEGELNLSTALNRNLSLNAGVDARVGAEVSILGEEIISWQSGNIELFDTLLWTAPKKISIIEGNNQTGEVKSVLPNSIKVQVLDSKNTGCPFIPVYFETALGNGTPSETKVITDITGNAVINWTLGDIEGTQTLNAYLKDVTDKEIVGSRISILATAGAPPVKRIVIVEGNNQTGEIECELADSVKIQVLDDTDAICSSVAVYFEAAEGNGTPSKTEVITDANGYAKISWTLGSIEGSQTLSAYLKDENDTEIEDSRISILAAGEANDEPPANETGTFTDLRDNKTYKWVKIGEQTWMAENLAYLPNSLSAESSYTEPYYYVYGYEGTSISEAKATENYSTYGVLYNWTAAMNGAENSDTNPSGVQGICPDGWHLPSDSEWTQLNDYLIDNGYNYDGTTNGNKIGKALASTSGWETTYNTGDIGNDQASNNSSGFTAVSGGARSIGGAFYGIGFNGYWWSSSEGNTSMAYFGFLDYDISHLGGHHNSKCFGFSVRCLRD